LPGARTLILTYRGSEVTTEATNRKELDGHAVPKTAGLPGRLRHEPGERTSSNGPDGAVKLSSFIRSAHRAKSIRVTKT